MLTVAAAAGVPALPNFNTNFVVIITNAPYNVARPTAGLTLPFSAA